MTHTYHEALPGYDPRQLLHDGCRECENRGKDASAISHLDEERFPLAWRRAYDLWASNGDQGALGRVADCEQKLLHVLWTIQVQLEARGWPLTGDPPAARMPKISPAGLDALRRAAI